MPLSSAEDRLCKRIAARAADLLDDLRLHVNLPTGGTGPALDESRSRLTDRLAALGAKVSIDPGDPRPVWLNHKVTATHGDAMPRRPVALASRTAGKPGARFLLSGHLDTVHEPDSAFRELSLRPDGQRATGPGCVDMKGGLVIAVAALEALDDAGFDPAWSFILSSDEETGSYSADRALRAAAREHDFGLAFEPALSDGSLVVERPGSGQFMIEVLGRMAHVGRDFSQGVNAITALARAIERVAQWPDTNRGLIVNVGVVDGGTATNVVPAHARAWGNLRFFDDQAAMHAVARLEGLRTSPSSGPPEVHVFHSLNRPAKPATVATMQLADAARRAAEDLAQKLPFGKTGGVCEGNNLQAVGLPTIDTLGVRGGGLHTHDEWIDLSSLVERCQLTALLIARQGR